jgi:DNA-binding SARP family transcriptional activator
MTGDGPALVQLTGAFKVRAGTREVPAAAVASRKARTLLRLLAARPDETFSSAALATTLWPVEQPAKPEAVLASLVSRLRRSLGADVISGGRAGYRAGALETDLLRARALLDEAERATPALAVTAAQAALKLLTDGDALVDEDDADWVDAVRTDAQLLRRRARHVLGGAAADVGQGDLARSAARRALDADPFDEDALRILMRSAQRDGRTADALQAYDAFRRALADELGVDPSPQTQAMYQAVLRGIPAAAPDISSIPDRLSLTGRGEEMTALADAWAAACRHAASCVLLAGEPGIGKTRLLTELCALAERTGGRVLQTRCFEGERSLFAQPLVDIVDAALRQMPHERVRAAMEPEADVLVRVFPELARMVREPPGEPRAVLEDRSRTFASIAAFMRQLSADGPLLIALDDLQNAGRSTLELLHYLARRLGACRVLVAAASRIENSNDPDGPVSVLKGVSTVVPVGPLSVEAVAELAASAGHADRAGDIVRRTAGHPLFVVEVLRALDSQSDELPESVRSAVLDRVARAGPGTERLLRAAAVLGSSFDPTSAAALVDVPATRALEHFERGLAARLLLTNGHRYEFAHDVVREILLATTPSPTRTALHARAADLLAGRPEAVAPHVEAIGDGPRASRAWLQAAERARERFAAGDAEAFAVRALVLASAGDDQELIGRSYVERGRARDARGSFAAAYDDYAAARVAARRAGDRRLEATALRELAGDVPIALGLPPASCEEPLAQCLGLASSLGDRAMEADVLDRLAVLRCSALDFVEGRQFADRALQLARSSEDEAALVHGLDATKTVLAYLGLVDRLEPVVAELEPVLRRRGGLWGLQWVVFEGSFVPLARGAFDEALLRMTEAVEICRRSGYTAQETFFLAYLGWVHRLAGDLDPALQYGRDAVERGSRSRHTWWRATAAAMLGATLLDCGNPAAAAQIVRPAIPRAEVAAADAYVLRALAVAADATGDPEMLSRADVMLDSIRAPDGCEWLLGADAYVCTARAWRRAGNPHRADEILGRLANAAHAAGWTTLLTPAPGA